jgi:hypothetical protein
MKHQTSQNIKGLVVEYKEQGLASGVALCDKKWNNKY